jgi:hypothetical protein
MWHMWGTGGVHTEVWWGDLAGKDQLEDLGIDGKIILKLICKRYGEAWIGLIWLMIGQVMGDCECGNKPMDSIKRGEFLN